MKQLNEHHSFTGMQRDMSIAKHPSSFLYDAHNIRLTARGEDTLLTITNERGPSYAGVEIKGTYLGHCLLGKYLTVFSTGGLEEGDDTLRDYITRIDLSTKESVVLYKGNLEFDVNNLIETVASYENEKIQKIYWTDGKNQPRLINIVDNNIRPTDCDTQFDFIRELSLQEEVTIQKQLDASGSFAPGVIQYAFTYYTKYGQETNIFYTSPLLYISHKDRGGSPEDKVENAFRIGINKLDPNFEYVRIYSIQRTSLDAVPIVKRVQDINYKEVNTSHDCADYDYVNSFYSVPVVVEGETILNQEIEYDYIGVSIPWMETSISNPDWRGYKKADHPNLVIMTESNKVTWGKDSTPNSVIWVSRNDYSYDNNYGYKVCETTNNTPTTEETDAEKLQEADFNYDVSFLDTGTSGDIIDPTELLYKGGESIIVQTIEQKDNTLFLGGITTERKPIEADLKNAIKNTQITQDTRIFYPSKVSSEPYIYSNQLSATNVFGNKSIPCGGFKKGDYYRCGVQFQYKNGRWSDPIFINDVQILNKPYATKDINAYEQGGHTETVATEEAIVVPTLSGEISSITVNTLYNAGYRKARAVVVYPELQDRVTICQGVICPTLYTQNNRFNDKRLYAQSSWFFRPTYGNNIEQIGGDGAVSPCTIGTLPYTSGANNEGEPTFTGLDTIRQVEIQGDFDDNDKFIIDSSFVTLHSPDIEFDDTSLLSNFAGTYYRNVGEVSFDSTLSDISIQTESPAISAMGNGFVHKGFVKSSLKGMQGIISGLFYEDFAVDDAGDKYQAYTNENSPYKWLVYAWHKSGSLNNDINRPADKGTRTSVLKKKIISNLRFTSTVLKDDFVTPTQIISTPQVFHSDQVSILKIDNKIYQGNIDTLLAPSKLEGLYFAFNSTNYAAKGTDTPFNSNKWWKTQSTSSGDHQSLWYYTLEQGEWKWKKGSSDIGDGTYALVSNKETVRMKYKSSPHLVLEANSSIIASDNKSKLPIVEIIRVGDNYTDTNETYYRSTMFGGTSEDALKANKWIPCGEPVTLVKDSDCIYKYSYGDTYFQRWDCLKTYPFSFDDINQIVEIGSFMLETRCNIDGRYDRNRGQISNLNVSPINFNLFNPVYNQINNFFTYRILDKSYYETNVFPNQITWTKEKKAGADVDLWTNITLASTYDMDGSKGEVRAIRTWQDSIYCFQDLGISNILFNSRVQIPTSDGVPIEISNSYKVDGYRYISDGIGCTNKWTISNTPSGLYFADTKTNHLHHIGSQGIQDVTTIHNMTSWFNNVDSNRITKTLHDDVNHDLYALTPDESICYSEVLGNFTSFMSYQGISLIESYENSVYTMKDGKLYSMFTGEYNKFFGENYEPWDFTFISNGIDNNLMDFDKVYSTIDYRMDMSDSTGYQHDDSLDFIRVYNEYQDTEDVNLNRSNTSLSFWNKEANLQKKFRIWRIQIPRDKKGGNGLDRIRNTWCKIKLGSKGKNNYKAILHDLNVQYYL